MTKHLIIPDAHAEPGVDNGRFTALGKLIANERPDVIVCLGDWASMDSLSSYDKGKKSFEGRRYRKDIAAANDALDRVEAGIAALNKQLAKEKKKQYKPRKVLVWGNHEERIDRAVNACAELEGTMSKDDIKFKEHGWETYEYMDVVAVDGVYYSHCMSTGISGKPISGENPAATLLKKHYVSCVVGHSHIYDYAERTRADGVKINAIVAGCFCNHVMSYASATQHMWYAGITILDDVKNGDFDFRRISLKRIMKDYK
jgi:predicted phosphodiesterase